jgi:hypothetical protein
MYPNSCICRPQRGRVRVGVVVDYSHAADEVDGGREIGSDCCFLGLGIIIRHSQLWFVKITYGIYDYCKKRSLAFESLGHTHLEVCQRVSGERPSTGYLKATNQRQVL